jgi:hypothetical protein
VLLLCYGCYAGARLLCENPERIAESQVLFLWLRLPPNLIPLLWRYRLFFSSFKASRVRGNSPLPWFLPFLPSSVKSWVVVLAVRESFGEPSGRRFFFFFPIRRV